MFVYCAEKLKIIFKKIYKICQPMCFYCFLCFLLGLLCDLLWSDPDKDVQGWGENDRGVSFTFGADVVNKFLSRHDLDLICRAHQVSECCQEQPVSENPVAGF